MLDRPHQIVNYMWLAKEAQTIDHSDQGLCNLPLHYIDKALHNAKRYADAEFHIWVDWRGLDDFSKFTAESYLYYRDCPNVRFCDLNDIPNYADDARLSGENPYDIWPRVDYTRLLILRHCLTQNSWCQVFYSDFDANDVEIMDDAIQEQMRLWGIVTATNDVNEIENSFFGFNEKGMEFLNDLVRRTERSFAMKDNGYGALIDFMEAENFTSNMRGLITSRASSIAVKKMPVSQAGSIKPKKLFRQLGLC